MLAADEQSAVDRRGHCAGIDDGISAGVDRQRGAGTVGLYEAAGLVVELEAGTANGTVARDRVVHIDERDRRTAALDWGIVL